MNINCDPKVEFREWELEIIKKAVDYYIMEIKKFDIIANRHSDDYNKLQKYIDSILYNLRDINDKLMIR